MRERERERQRQRQREHYLSQDPNARCPRATRGRATIEGSRAP